MTESVHPIAAEFRPLVSEQGVAHAVAESWSHPVLIFKHSLTCGVSAMAHQELREMVSGSDAVPVYQIAVQRNRSVSHVVARQFNIRHESPQLLLISEGEVRWHASHFRVTADEVQQALKKLAAGDPAPTHVTWRS